VRSVTWPPTAPTISSGTRWRAVSLVAACASSARRYVACTVTGGPVDLAGPAANLVAGLAAWGTGRVTRRSPVVHLTLLLTAAFNLFWFEGQLVFDAATARDDWQELLRAVAYSPAWRIGLVGVGAATYLLTVRGLGAALRRLAAGDRRRRPAGVDAGRGQLRD